MGPATKADQDPGMKADGPATKADPLATEFVVWILE